MTTYDVNGHPNLTRDPAVKPTLAQRDQAGHVLIDRDQGLYWYPITDDAFQAIVDKYWPDVPMRLRWVHLQPGWEKGQRQVDAIISRHTAAAGAEDPEAAVQRAVAGEAAYARRVVRARRGIPELWTGEVADADALIESTGRPPEPWAMARAEGEGAG